ncbi:nuclear pore complex protein Nup155 [Lepisosteus oculatus]|uniref:nuclear pore complex protein Nup155 n=1 Tax=Lepisosteus oculatus TaxID=7918 RepID=UPI0003EAAA31|nr:PREDICTED: nuclear pore complex protein Nup155 [Lepisosteus oculatus]XP_015195863.1 PREDICTED: nuclear pore complex protein Nup155 [Lepisosteus oculatus]XP_015195864.1 PREDICTED: nuclear pore complex protein Nup155 [Lepisosteus oculatus]XP_015195865.1 PREDICTED: nuclear pore complex protein Nup155 [Lepisosteus oculatus]
MPSSLGASNPAAALQEALENTGRLIDRHLQDDRCFPDLSELLNVPAHNMPSLSGMSDMDYPLQGPGLLTVPSLPEISPVRRVPLPPELVEQFSHMQCNCMMGVFPEISRAWLTIDNDIFMWNYEDGGDVAYFDGLSETILSVGLVKPKEGIFQPHIQYLLVLATPVDVVILGLSFPGSQAGALNDSMSSGMQLLPDPLYSIPTDNTYLLAVTSTDLGRIFLAGKDGCLYEIAYQAEAGWFSQRCRKINHSKSTLSFLIPSVLQFTFSEDDPIVQIAIDNSRNTLYTRSEKGVIQVYDLGVDGQGMSRVAGMSQNSIVSAAGNIARTIDRSVFKPIVQIAVIERSESSDCHLLAITHAGVRLYFSTTPFSPPNARHTSARPGMLVLVHVRLPPGFSASATLQKPSKVHKALYSKGVLLMAASETEDGDILWCINHDSFPFKKPLMEAQMTSTVDGHTWSLCAVEESRAVKVVTPLNRDLVPHTDSPVVVQQHNIPPKKFVLLSAKGSHIFHKLRPVDQLRHLLVSCAGGDGEEIERFFKLHREEQACATALILACSSAAYDREVSLWASRAFFRYGGEAQMRFASALSAPVSSVGPMLSSPVPGSPLPISSPVPNPSFLATPAPGSYPPSVSTPFVQAPSMGQAGAPITAMAGPEVVFSGKHNGICIYFSRILGNIWDGSLATEKTISTGNQQVTIMESSVPSSVLESVLQELRGLKDFLDKNSQFSPGSLGAVSFSSPGNLQQRLLGFMRPDGGSSQQVQQELQRKYHTEAQAYEKISLQGIQQLVHHTCQTLALWKLLCDHQFGLILNDLPKEFQEQVKVSSFKDIVIRGRELTGALITSLINCYIKDSASVDAISCHLRETCPLLYSSDDSVCSKANELLQSTRQIQNKAEREKMLRESLRLYQQISHQTDLPHVCAQYRQVRFYEGVVELCLTAADKKDPQRLGPHFYKNGEPEEDAAGQQAFQERLNSYKCITDAMQDLVNQSKAAPQSPSVPKQPGPPVMSSDPNMLSNEDAAAHFEQMIGLAQRSKDELFHIALYNWLIQADLTDKLLEVNSPYLEEHLMRMMKQDQNKVRYMDLLWRYYEKSRNFSKAAHVLARLADMHSTEISLRQRLEYISRAILSAKSSSCASSQASDGEFLHELEEKMEVVRIQVQIQETLSRQYSHHPSVQGAISQLDSELMDITKLYGEFADHFRLSECKLAIIHCAGHSEPMLVHTLWQEIVEKELSDSVAMSPADRMRALSLKLVSLGKIYAGTPRYFPLEFLVKFLEQEVCRLSWDVGFVTYTMQEIGVQLPRLLEVYDQLFRARDPCWQRLKRPLHLVECIHVLLSGYVEDPSRVPSYDRRRFTTFCLDCICGYLVELQSLSPNSALQQLIGNFKSLQAKVEKVL